jgi:hypothetical protein
MSLAKSRELREFAISQYFSKDFLFKGIETIVIDSKNTRSVTNDGHKTVNLANIKAS